MPSEDLERIFPKLRPGDYSVDSPATRRYNCIAWAAGVALRCWWPVHHPRYDWPIEPRVESLEGFIQAFRTLGYELCDDSSSEAGYEKVAIYADEGDIPTHMARQLESGLWTSKCGDLEDITHSLDGLEGDAYGRVAQVLRRRR
jgi:hypothetical protein